MSYVYIKIAQYISCCVSSALVTDVGEQEEQHTYRQNKNN